jgi:hypothetical protein
MIAGWYMPEFSFIQDTPLGATRPEVAHELNGLDR